MAERVQRKMLELVEHGHPVGGKRVYGYRWVPGEGRVVDPAEAAIVTEVVRRVLAKETLASIAADLTDRGVLTAKGDRWGVLILRKILTNPQPEEAWVVEVVREQESEGRSHSEIVRGLNQAEIPLPRRRRWTANTLRDLLTCRALVGDLTHHGEVRGRGAWQPIVSREDWEAVQRELAAPERHSTAPPGGVVRYLLSGLIRCGGCGNPMTAGYETRGVTRYACRHRGCLRVAIHQPKLDAHVTGFVLGLLANPAVRVALEYGSQDQSERLHELGQEIARLEAAREAEQEEYAEKKAAGDDVDRGLAAATIKRINQRLDDARNELAAITRRTNLLQDVPAEPDLRWWAGLALGRQRALVELVCGRMTVAPAAKRGPVFDPSRLRFPDLPDGVA
jgi:hypothetical protein